MRRNFWGHNLAFITTCFSCRRLKHNLCYVCRKWAKQLKVFEMFSVWFTDDNYWFFVFKSRNFNQYEHELLKCLSQFLYIYAIFTEYCLLIIHLPLENVLAFDDSDGNPVILQDPAFTYICKNAVSLANSSKVIESLQWSLKESLFYCEISINYIFFVLTH